MSKQLNDSRTSFRKAMRIATILALCWIAAILCATLLTGCQKERHDAEHVANVDSTTGALRLRKYRTETPRATDFIPPTADPEPRRALR